MHYWQLCIAKLLAIIEKSYNPLKDIKEVIWEKLNSKHRNSHARISRFSNVNFLERIGELYGRDFLEELLNKTDLIAATVSESFTIPKAVIQFIDLFVEADQPQNVIDPWFNKESYLTYDKIKGKGFCPVQEEFAMIKELPLSKNINLKLGDGLKLLESNEELYDLVVSFPPLGRRIRKPDKTISGDYSSDLLIESCKHLTDNGYAIFLTSTNLSFDGKIRASLKENGVQIKGLFQLPEGSLLPLTAINTYIVIAQKQAVQETFVAELSNDDLINRAIFKNFKNQIEGKKLPLGRFVDFESFKSYNNLSQLEELRRIGQRTGLTAVKLPELSEYIKTIKNEKEAKKKHNSSKVYIPKIGNSPVVTSPSDFRIKPNNYLQVCLKNEQVNPDFLSNYFSTELGRLSLESCQFGNAMPSISVSSLSDCIVYIPDYSTQIATIDVNNKLNIYRQKLSLLQSGLWKRPVDFRKILKEIKPFEKASNIETWLDEIPFPLSSILWKYYATTNPKDKYEYLLHFFEALPEFLCMILLSAYNQNREFYESQSKEWLKNDKKFSDWYKRTDFGGWNNQFANLAKATRTFISNNEKKDLVLNLLGRPDRSFLDFITSKQVFNILDEVRSYRNDWKAHGGVSNKREDETRVTLLEQKLGELREIIKNSFSNCRIIVPGTNSYENGVFSYKVKELIGNRTPFNETEIESTIPMDVNRLYFLTEDNTKPIELLPFIKYNQESKACYFYNKIESGNSRWVSFHFEETSEIKEPLDSTFEEVLSILRQKE